MGQVSHTSSDYPYQKFSSYLIIDISLFIHSFSTSEMRRGKHDLANYNQAYAAGATEKIIDKILYCNQGVTLALARSPRRVSKVSGERKSSITPPFGEYDFNCQEIIYIAK